MKRIALLTVLTSLTVLSPAFAQSARSGFYAGVAVGRSTVDDRSRAASPIAATPGLPQSLSINGLPFDDHHTSWSAFAGFKATRYIGVELGYWDHGTFKNERLLGPEPASLGIQEVYFGATLMYPLASRLTATGSAGISRARFDVDGAATALVVSFPGVPGIPTLPFPVRPPVGVPVLPPGTTVTVPLATPDDETGAYWQVGLNWRFTASLEAGVSYGRRDLSVQKVEALSLSLRHTF